MTTPRPHAELAARYYADASLECWYRRNPNRELTITSHPVWDADGEYHVGHEPPSIKRTITLTVNGREWVLPEPLREHPSECADFWFVTHDLATFGTKWFNDQRDVSRFDAGNCFGAEADAQAWAEFDKWCRGGGDVYKAGHAT